MANTVRIERVILTALDSSSQIYMRICVINEIMPAMRENTPAICDEKGRVVILVRSHSQCHMIHIHERLAP